MSAPRLWLTTGIMRRPFGAGQTGVTALQIGARADRTDPAPSRCTSAGRAADRNGDGAVQWPGK
jgi:hypothetical protein